MPFTLTVNFTLANPDPGSYRVKFWPTNDPTNITTRLITGSPFVEGNLSSNNYTGTIEAVCGGGVYSTPVSFSVTPAIDDIYLSITEFTFGSNKRDVRWILSDSAGTTSITDPSARTVPFDIKLGYTLVGTNVMNSSSPTGTVSGLQLMSGNKYVIQGSSSDELTGVRSVTFFFKETTASTWNAGVTITDSGGINVNNPVTYINTSTGLTYRINFIVNSFYANIYT